MPHARVHPLHPSRHGEAPVDVHTPVHFLVGFAAGVLGVNTYLAVCVFIGVKVVDQVLHMGPHALLKSDEGQSLGNEAADLLFEMGGLAVGEKLREKLAPEPTAPPVPTAGLEKPDRESVVKVNHAEHAASPFVSHFYGWPLHITNHTRIQ